MSKLLKKISISFLLFLFLFLGVFGNLAPAKAQVWYNQSFLEWHNKVYNSETNDIFGERYTAAQVQWIIYSLASLAFTGVSQDANQIITCVTTKTPEECSVVINDLLGSSTDGSDLAQTGNQSLIREVFKERPLSAVSYFKDLGRNVKLIPEAQAQTTGFGFTALDPVLELWKATRNVVYALFVLVVIAMAFMIMFRVKISPQVVITVQSALPKVVIALILVTFSYAIAGFLIDLMYVFIGIISLALSGSGLLSTGKNSVEVFKVLTQGPEIFGLHLGIFGFLARYYATSLGTLFLIALGADSDILKIGLGIFVIIGIIVLIIVLIFIGLKITWMLFKTLANIFIATIFAPFQILIGTLVPGMGFGAWLRNYISNLVVFPIVGLLFMLATIFMGVASTTAFKSLVGFGTLFLGFLDKWLGINQMPEGWPPLLATGSATVPLIFFGTSFVIMTIIPKTVEMIQSIIKGQPLNYGAAIGEAVNPYGLSKTAGFYGAENVIQRIEGKALLADRDTGLDVAAARVARRVLGLKK